MEVTGDCETFDLDDNAAVGAARRRLLALAMTAGLDESRAGDAALIATELGSNVLKHAQRGGAILSVVREEGQRGVAIATWDRGRGMNVEACMRDGMSTAGTRGAGLGAVARIATRFDAFSRPGLGSVVTATVFPRVRDVPVSQFTIGGICIPYPGLTVSGDAWAARVDGDVATILVCDGLGHGDGAAAASAVVIAAFRKAPHDPLSVILERADRAARSTRGAAGTIARIDRARRELTVAGIGNVSVWLVGDTHRQLVTQHGTLGQATPSAIREERHAFPPKAQVILCSDGIKSRWALDGYPGLLSRDPLAIATVMWRDLSRGRDDASVVIAREAVP